MHEYVTPGGRKVWDRWGTTPCYNSRGKMRPAPLHCHKPCRPALTKRKIAAGKKSLWMRALNEYNKSNGNWCVPKENTAEYVAVLDIMERLKREDAQRDADAEDDVPLTEFVRKARAKTRYTQQDADADFERAMEEDPGGPSAFRLPRRLPPTGRSTNKVKLLNVMDVYRTERDPTLDRMQNLGERMDLVLRKARELT